MFARSIPTWPLALALVACSDDAASNDEVVGEIRSNVTWRDGTKLAGVVRIFEGATVEIEPGARISCVESAHIQVGGVLKVTAAGRHATIGCPRWTGIIVAQNGRLEVDGLDLDNPEIGIETTSGAGAVTVANSVINNAVRPFRVGANSTLALKRVRATTAATTGPFDVSVSEVFGSLVAQYLDYDAKTHEGIMVQEGGEADIEDSTLRASQGLDLVSSYGGKSVKIRYTTMTGSHCGPHIDASRDAKKTPTGSIELDHITSEGNIFGVTLYATATAGTLVIKNSNFQGENAWLDLQGNHGRLVFENVFSAGGATIVNTEPPVIQRASARIDNAKPR